MNTKRMKSKIISKSSVMMPESNTRITTLSVTSYTKGGQTKTKDQDVRRLWIDFI